MFSNCPFANSFAPEVIIISYPLEECSIIIPEYSPGEPGLSSGHDKIQWRTDSQLQNS